MKKKKLKFLSLFLSPTCGALVVLEDIGRRETIDIFSDPDGTTDRPKEKKTNNRDPYGD
ncbi:MAG: hypothetical protein IT291_03075 [Deltaproteobacteria bacterium]|nr:hypothetical protein [Deltaproteobacteria bacterium]